MKKLVALLVVCGLLLGVAGIYTADAAAKKAPAKKATKKVVKKPVKKAAPKKAAPKAAPAPYPVAPVPPPPPAPVVVAKPAAPAGLFGLGWNTDLNGTFISTGKGSLGGAIAARGDLVLADPMALGALVGLPADTVTWMLGLGYVQGNALKAIPVYLDGSAKIPASWVGGLDMYLAGGLNYPVLGNGNKTGRYGIEAVVGLNVDFGLGKTGLELGYTVVRSNTQTDKGVSLGVNIPVVL